ncbi:MAG: hypothetical protein LBU57_03660 [Dysgonamonadaceae bacterium]|nr:hypothetical protein [Dysgonamonadaceae bacterium]
MKKKKYILPVLFSLFLLTDLFGNIPQSPVIFREGKAEIRIKDNLCHPLFWWPATLLSYPIVFDEVVSGDDLILIDSTTSKQIPFQLTGYRKKADGKMDALLYIMSDLPSGGEFVFFLKKGVPENFPVVGVTKNNDRYTVRTDKLFLEFPVSQNRSDNIPGPVLSIGQPKGKSMGDSRFFLSKEQSVGIKTTIVCQGPLFAELEISYSFSGGAVYRANIRCIKGYDFIELREQMEGFTSKKEEARWEFFWNGFSPTHRQAPNHPYGQPGTSPGFNRFEWEKIDQDVLNSHHGIMYSSGNGKIPYEIGIYGNWPAERNVTSTLFWDWNSGQSVGAFTKDIAYWDERDYAIWTPSGRLNVMFYYHDNLLKWVYPLYNGRRSTAISCYHHRKDIDYMEELERLNRSDNPAKPAISQLSYNTFLQNRYSTINLNTVKDWDLAYPEPLRIPEVLFARSEINSVEELEQQFYYGTYSNELAVGGPCQNSGFSPVPARDFYNRYVPAFNRWLSRMTPDQRKRLSAMFLMHAYMAASEEYMPMRVMLSGHPNFLADVKSIPVWAAFLFPEHPEAKNWSEMFGKYVELNTHYHTRPDVSSWNAQGGRWTENLGTYVWAFMGPTVKANYLIQHYGSGKNQLAQYNTAQIASWIVHSLSAPYSGESLDFYKIDGVLPKHFWGILTENEAFRRVHPPQGAHAARRKPSSSLWILGDALQNYEPLLAENIRYVSSPRDQEMEQPTEKNPFNIMYPNDGYDMGTPPDFKSMKMTGYGIILRAAVGTKDELSIHLSQIDRGPNYRWGVPSEGGCGTIYFFAAGKSYSHNGKEDSGDRKVQDLDLVTNFGVYKNGCFKAIGRNDLDRPLYDLSVGQFAEITSSKESGYSWPEYQSRSIMLVGSDYFIVYDDVYNNNIGSRFSWFTHPLEDFPEIKVIKSGGRNEDVPFSVEEIKHSGRESKGIWYDGSGDMMTFVSHKKNFTTEATPFGCIVTSKDGKKDYIFRNDISVKTGISDYHFSGTSGFIRECDNRCEMVSFHGTEIGNNAFEIRSQTPDMGISAVYISPDNINGNYYGTTVSEVVFRWTRLMPQPVNFYLDGKKQTVRITGNEMMVTVPAGRHIWNISKGLPVLNRPEIKYTKNEKGLVFLSIYPVSGAQRYRYEYSIDGGEKWITVKEQQACDIRLKPMGKERKGYIKVTAVNNEHESESSRIYPVYFTHEKPHYPEGLKLVTIENGFTLTWGRVLGCLEYKLYRKKKGDIDYQLIYRGERNDYDDRSVKNGELYDYIVSAVNGNGESAYSHAIDNDPDNWLNFEPVPGEPFRRVTSRHSMIDYSGGPDQSNKSGRFYYPE